MGLLHSIISIVPFLILDGKICLLIWEQIRNGTAPFHHQYCFIPNSSCKICLLVFLILDRKICLLIRNRSGMGLLHSIISIVPFLILNGKICLLIWEQIRNGTAPFHHQYCSISNSGSQNFACLYRNRSGMGLLHSIISIVPFLILDCKICLLYIPYSGRKICLLIQEQIRNGDSSVPSSVLFHS